MHQSTIWASCFESCSLYFAKEDNQETWTARDDILTIYEDGDRVYIDKLEGQK